MLGRLPLAVCGLAFPGLKFDRGLEARDPGLERRAALGRGAKVARERIAFGRLLVNVLRHGADVRDGAGEFLVEALALGFPGGREALPLSLLLSGQALELGLEAVALGSDGGQMGGELPLAFAGLLARFAFEA